jgi:hypothetical protein
MTPGDPAIGRRVRATTLFSVDPWESGFSREPCLDGGVIVTMALLFAALFLWQKNVEKSGYFANIYREAMKPLASDHPEKWPASCKGGTASSLPGLLGPTRDRRGALKNC